MESESDIINVEFPSLRPETLQLGQPHEDLRVPITQMPVERPMSPTSSTTATSAAAAATNACNPCTIQLASSTIRIIEPPLVDLRKQLKDLIGKQNKIYVDLLAEKFELDNADISKLTEMMLNVRLYREKIVQIRKRMQNIYHRTQDLKKRSAAIQAYKQKELHRKQIQQQHEEALIGGK